MPRPDELQVAMCSAEFFPYVKVGGLGDMVGSLSKALARLGLKVIVLMPAYKAIHH